MSSTSPPSSHGASVGGSLGVDATDLSSASLEQLKALQEKKVTKEGKTPKKRGPKPDTKPALTRRQELNRQAQRTHRERKEMYIKALEDEVLRLKDVYTGSTQDKQKLADENQHLKALLQQHGIAPPETTHNISLRDQSLDDGSSRGGSAAAGSQSAYTPVERTTTNNQQTMDYEQAGIDFVLTLEQPCMSHVRLVRGIADETGLPFGHAMMGSCPLDLRSKSGRSAPHEHAETGSNGTGNGAVQTGELSRADLATLLTLSSELDLRGEITPVMAWSAIMNHPQAQDLAREDLVRVTQELQGKVRCYGFGAVFEEFELRDALEAVLGSKRASPMLVC